jgi:hypothetical protein
MKEVGNITMNKVTCMHICMFFEISGKNIFQQLLIAYEAMMLG